MTTIGMRVSMVPVLLKSTFFVWGKFAADAGESWEKMANPVELFLKKARYFRLEKLSPFMNSLFEKSFFKGNNCNA
eukprot:CAMPEP_0184856520 /NCGR_PEP_ID=MMETSP0580-20130426/1714_1 /TAXON_ID=1118495 /ORGANISM="Dactyliosolen fragilissimus" /LENGTH=75 /DNA_ID=CAMNT_0027351605 /DNA_START=419 /DNA_END=643 /DNA_ORIENTATION=-